MIYTIGETVYDVIFRDGRPIDGKVGGSMLNTAVSLGRAGLPVAFVSAVGNDPVGEMCVGFLDRNNIRIDTVTRYDGKSFVALAFLDSNNNASYVFHDDRETPRQLNSPAPKGSDIILFGSLFSLDALYRDRLMEFLVTARKQGSLIMYDPNFRPSLLPRLPELLPIVREYMAIADIIKGSDEDFAHLLGLSDAGSVYSNIAPGKDKLLIYTANKKCVEVIFGSGIHRFDVPAIMPVSTIGAGDTFSAGVLYTLFHSGVTRAQLPAIPDSLISTMANTAIRFARHVCMSYDNYISEEFAQSLNH